MSPVLASIAKYCPALRLVMPKSIAESSLSEVSPERDFYLVRCARLAHSRPI